jgi:hypothetical protein
MRPEDANPQNFQHNGNIIYTSPDGFFSIARGYWSGDEEGTTRLAMRWNGDINNSSDLGHPNVRGYPMWFQLPSDNDGYLPDVARALLGN